jgi:hypothetical protein
MISSLATFNTVASSFQFSTLIISILVGSAVVYFLFGIFGKRSRNDESISPPRSVVQVKTDFSGPSGSVSDQSRLFRDRYISNISNVVTVDSSAVKPFIFLRFLFTVFMLISINHRLY